MIVCVCVCREREWDGGRRASLIYEIQNRFLCFYLTRKMTSEKKQAISEYAGQEIPNIKINYVL